MGWARDKPDRRNEEAAVTRIDVDFNAVGREGLVKISRRRADGDFAVGDPVELYDASEPEMTFLGRVEEVDDQGRGLARVDWQEANTPVSYSGASHDQPVHRRRIQTGTGHYTGG